MFDKETMQYFSLIGQLQKTIQKSDNLEQAVSDCVKLFKQYLSSDCTIVWYTDEDATEFHPYYFLSEKDMTFAKRLKGSGAVGRSFENCTVVRMLDYSKGMDPEADADMADDKITSSICVPFMRGENILGVIQFFRLNESQPFSEVTADVAEIMMNMISIAILENEKLCQPWRFNQVILSAQNITRSFQNGDELTVVLKGVNMDVYQGEFVVILGESGSGKSTFMNIIGGMDHADSGTFQFMGQEMSGLNENQLTEFRRDNIGFIFQSYNLISSLTAAQNIDLIGELVDDHLTSDEVLEMVKLKDKRNNYPSQLSGGQQQRVSIARALVKKPKLIFADEPTSALDYATSIDVLSVLERIVKEGTTLVMVTHNEEITRMADRIVRMRNGKTFDITLNRNPVHATDLVW